MLIRSGVAVTASSTYERLTTLAGVVVLSRLMAPAEFGYFALAVSTVAIPSQLLDFAAHYALISRPSLDAAVIWAHALVQCGAAAAIVLACGAAWPIISAAIGDRMASLIAVIAVTRLVIAIGITSRVLQERDFRYVSLAAVNVAAATASLAIGIALAQRGWGVWALALGAGPPSLVGAIVQTAGYLFVRPLEFSRFKVDLGQVRWYLAYGRPLWLGTQAVSIGTQLDNIAVGTFVGPGALGFYDRAYRLVQSLVALANQTFGRIALSAYSRLHRSDIVEARRAQELNAGLLLRVALPVGACLAVTGTDLIEVLIGPTWGRAGTLLMLLAPYFLFRALDENLLAYFIGAGRTWDRTVGWLIVAGISVPALLILVPVLGAVGAPIGVGLAMGAGVWWQQRRVEPRRFGPVVTDALRPLAAVGAAATVALFLGHRVGPARGAAVSLALKATLLLVMYSALLVTIDRARLRQLAVSLRVTTRALVRP